MNETQEMLPLKKGDTFMIGPFHFVCMGWENGRIKAMRRTYPGFIMHSLSVEIALSPGFRLLKKVSHENT